MSLTRSGRQRQAPRGPVGGQQLAQHQQRGGREADHRGDRGAGHAQAGERAGPEDEQRVQDDVQHQADGHHLERERGVALAAEQRVDAHGEHAEEATQEVDPPVLQGHLAHLRVGVRGVERRLELQQQHAAGDQHDRDQRRQQDHVQQQIGHLVDATGADQPRARAGAGGADGPADGVQQVGDRKRQADGGHRFLGEAAEIEHVDQPEERHQHHGQDHRDAQAEQRGRDLAGEHGVGAAAGGATAQLADAVEPGGHADQSAFGRGMGTGESATA